MAYRPGEKCLTDQSGSDGFDDYVSHDNFFEMNPPMSRQGAPRK